MNLQPDEGKGDSEARDLLHVSEHGKASLWPILTIIALLGWLAWSCGALVPLPMAVLAWAGVSGAWLYVWARSQAYDVWMSDRAFIIKAKEVEWEVPFDDFNWDGIDQEWFYSTNQKKGHPKLRVLPGQEGIIADRVGERLVRAGYDLGILGWRRAAELKTETDWCKAPFETGKGFSVVGCFVPTLGFLFSGIVLVDAGPWFVGVMAFWAGWTGLAALYENHRRRQRWKFIGPDLLTQTGRDEPVKFERRNIKALKIVQKGKGRKKGKQVLLVSHYGRETALSGVETAWSGSTARLLEEARARGHQVWVHLGDEA